MKEEIRKALIGFLNRLIKTLRIRNEKDIEDMKEISDEAIRQSAIHKEGDAVSFAVMVYSLYKIIKEISDEEYEDIATELNFARKSLQENNLGRYNKNIKTIFSLVSKSNAKIKTHLQDVLQAARIKEGVHLFKHGLSIGKAAEMMGLSTWDLLGYAGKTEYMEGHKELTSIKKRVAYTLKLFQ